MQYKNKTEQLLHTPDGVRDIYNGEYKRKLIVEEKLHQVFMRYGCLDIQTPTFEYFDVFNNQIGTIPSKDLYKFFDKEGNTLVLRPDFTPSIARCAAKYYLEEEETVKLCYSGNTFINSSDYQGRLKEVTQCGVEVIGDASVFADAETLAMVVEALRSVKIEEFQISVGHAGFFLALLEEAGIEKEAEKELRDLLNNKNFLGVEEFIENLDVDTDLKSLFGLLGSFHISMEDMQEAKKAAAKYPQIEKAIFALEELNRYLELFKIDRYVSFELGMISNYQYYTGIIFAGYTYGLGEPIVKGGRYDNLLSYFGKNAPAIGFAFVADQLLSAITRQQITISTKQDNVLIVFEKDMEEQAIELSMYYRKEGKPATMLFAEDGLYHMDKTIYEDYAKRHHIAKNIYLCKEI